MLKIGLTGGIGCGKSTVARLFAEFDTPIIDADEIAHQLVEKGQPALAKIVQQFGDTVLNSEGSLNRNYLRDLVFADVKQKQILEAILHPLIYEKMQDKINRLHVAYCIVCIPLMIETQMTHFVDRILVVDCPIETQINRVQHRDHLTPEKIHAILANQISRNVRLEFADDLIDNSATQTGLAEQVKKLHNLYLSLSTPGFTHL
jgi:dephospho-CoA kinase